MPTDSLLVSVAVVAVFLIFAAVLAWASVRAPGVRLPATEADKRRPF